MPITLALLIALGAAFLARPVGQHLGTRAGWLLALVPAALFVNFLLLGSGIAEDAAIIERIEWVPSLGVSLAFRLDGFSWLFSLLITGIGTLVVIYSGAYFAEAPAKRGASFISLILFFMTAMLGTVLSDDLIALFVFWELTSLASFALIGFDSHKPAAREAALQSLIVTAGGGLALFGGILLIGMELGTFRLSEVADRGAELVASPLAPAILVLVLIGTFAKSAQVPFHFWLPNAMEAPTPASAYLHSATMVKLGVYLLARFDQAFATMPAFGTTLVVFGSATMLVASVRALSRDGYKAVLAQTTVASLGMLVMLIGLDGPLAAQATIAFLFAHALYKAALFFCAGTAIHATGRKGLIELNGLAGALPVTAAAALLAAISMAGLPPTFSFIAKEAIFEAQIESSFGAFVIAGAVIGSAVFVAVAFLVSLRPFYLGRSRRVESHHGETPGLFLAPLVLGALGLLFGLVPGLVSAPLLAPAISALAGAPVEVDLSLWHGLTPMLAISALAVLLGLLLYVSWGRVLAILGRSDRLDDVLGDIGYRGLLTGLFALARGSTRRLQSGDQRRYAVVVIAATVAMVAFGLLASGVSFRFDLLGGPFHLSSAIVLAIMAIGAVVATRAGSLLTATVAAGIIGFGSAVIFLMNGAPDLALTQFSVEVLVVVILMALLLRLPMRAPSTRLAGERRIDIALAAGFATVVFLALATMVASPLDLRLTEYFAETSYTIAHGRNVVNVILVDYRGLDTLGEISVISFAAMAVWGLLRRRAARASSAGASS